MATPPYTFDYIKNNFNDFLKKHSRSTLKGTECHKMFEDIYIINKIIQDKDLTTDKKCNIIECLSTYCYMTKRDKYNKIPMDYANESHDEELIHRVEWIACNNILYHYNDMVSRKDKYEYN